MAAPRSKVDEESVVWSSLTAGQLELEARMTKRDLKYHTGTIKWIEMFEKVAARIRPIR